MVFENQSDRWFAMLVFLIGFTIFSSLNRRNHNRSGSWQRIGMMISWMLVWAVVSSELIIIVGSNIKLLFTIPIFGALAFSLVMIVVSAWDSGWEFGRFRERRWEMAEKRKLQ